MSAAAIEIKGLRKSYGDVEALRGIDLSVQPGEFFGLLGPNGAGKTTTINILSGLSVRSGGDVKLHGHDLDREYRACRREIGLVPQEFNFDQFIRVKKMLVFQGGFFGIPREVCIPRAERLLKTFDLADKGDAQVRQLSGGMKRRALIARALMHEPRILILDEPTAGVDVDLRKALWRFLREQNDAGTTIVLTTHYIEEAEELCDRVAIIREGEIIADDRTARLSDQLQHETLSVATREPVSKAALSALNDLNPELDDEAQELTISFDRHTLDYESVLRRLADAGLGIAHLTPVENRLEQVFLQLTSRGDA